MRLIRTESEGDISLSDLVVDEVYGGSRRGNASDDPLPKLVGVDSGAGFRHLGQRPGIDTLRLLVLKSNFSDPDWPDRLDTETGLLTYYGDNKRVGDIHCTPRQGNQILRNLFDGAHNLSTKHFPVILVFGGTGVYRDVRFLGLAVPGATTLGPDDDLVAIWRATGAQNLRFQNYRAVFTILDVPVVTREWIDDIKADQALHSQHAPKEWCDWIHHRKYSPLLAPHSLEARDKQRQLPATDDGLKVLDAVYSRFKDDPVKFEKCALEIARLMMPAINDWELTRPWRDGGRDALGTYRIGSSGSSIDVEFALEAKCYSVKSGVGVKPLSRLISRLRHRQFGVLVTTSYLSAQAYDELVEDKHPVVVISGADIVELLNERVGGLERVNSWLDGIESE